MLQKSYHTKTSDLISQFIQAKMDHGFTAAELSAFLKENGVDVNKTTVYRNLDKMTESGKLTKRKSMVSDAFVYPSFRQKNRAILKVAFKRTGASD